MAGVSPVEASSGRITRDRLNRFGDRRLNRALHTIVNWRMVHGHEPTQHYLARRCAEQKTDTEIRRCLKPYTARHLFRLMEATAAGWRYRKMDENWPANEETTTASDLVASTVHYRTERAFVLLLQLADRHFVDPAFSHAFAQSLRNDPALIELWEAWSKDQRWTPGAYVETTEVGWFDGAHRRNVTTHPDRGAAVADFIQRLAAWLARREVIQIEAPAQHGLDKS